MAVSRLASLLLQTAFCQPCQTIKVHYMACGASEQRDKGCEWGQTAANKCLGLSYGLCLFLSPIEVTVLMESITCL